MLLLGYMIFKEESERKAAQAALAQVQSTEAATKGLEGATKEIHAALAAGGNKDPNTIISHLVAAESVRAERDQLKKKVEDLDAKLTALVEFQARLAKAAPQDRPDITAAEVTSALALQDQITKTLQPSNQVDEGRATERIGVIKPAQPPPAGQTTSAPPPRPPASAIAKTDLLPLVRQALTTTDALKTQLKKHLGRELPVGGEAEVVGEVVGAASDFAKLGPKGVSPSNVVKDNADLRGQIAFLKHRLDARGGRDFPPCWADETGKVQFLFALEAKSDSITIVPAWPESREASARALTGIAEALNGPHSLHDFPSKIKTVFDWSKAQSPECRHYVQLKSTISDAVQSDRARLMVENFFYKVEARR